MDIKDIYINTYWEYYLSLEKRMLQTEEYVAFNMKNEMTYSFEYLSLLQTICSEIDVVAKAICYHFDKSFPVKKAKIQQWGYSLQKFLPDITKQTINFRKDINFIPWENWTLEERLNKKERSYFAYAEKCGTPFWWSAYNAVKHARTLIEDGQVNYQKANYKNVIYALGALYVLHRLMMTTIDKEMYNFMEKSKLFSIPGRYDEIRITYFYDSEGRICIHYGSEEADE